MQTGRIGRRALALVVVLMTVVGFYLLVALPVDAAGTVFVSPSSGVAGDSFAISGSGFESGEQLSLCFGNRPCSNLGKTTANELGILSAPAIVPAEATQGAQVVSVCGPNGCSQATFLVLAAPTTTVVSTTSSTTVTTIPTSTSVPGSGTTSSIANPSTTMLGDPDAPTSTTSPRTSSTVTSVPESTTTTELIPAKVGSQGGPPPPRITPEPADRLAQPDSTPDVLPSSSVGGLAGAESLLAPSVGVPAAPVEESQQDETFEGASAPAGPLTAPFDPDLFESQSAGFTIPWEAVRYVAIWLGGPALAILIVIAIDERRRTRIQ